AGPQGDADGEFTAEPALQSGDVLLAFDGHNLDENGFCDLLGRRLHFAAARDLRRIGASVPLSVWRDGQEQLVHQVLQPAQYLVPRGQFDTRPRFFAVGGLVFQPLSHEYLQGWHSHDRPAHLQELFQAGHLTPDRTEAVLLSQVLADEVSAGYDSGWVGAPIVRAINGQEVRNLAHLADIVRQARLRSEGFLTFDFGMSCGPFRIVLPLEGLDEADTRICSIYGLPPACCSSHYMFAS
ncbi:unnamed protein product, partial [Polarella glacialis]